MLSTYMCNMHVFTAVKKKPVAPVVQVQFDRPLYYVQDGDTAVTRVRDKRDVEMNGSYEIVNVTCVHCGNADTAVT